MLVETSLNVGQVYKAAHEQPGDNQQYDRKRNLSDDKRSRQRATRCGRRTAAPVLEGRCELKPRRPECRQHAEQKRRYHRDAEREAEHGHVGGQIQWNWIGAWRGHAQQHSTRLPCQRNTGRRSQKSKQHRLREKLQHNPAARCAQCHAHRELHASAPRRGPEACSRYSRRQSKAPAPQWPSEFRAAPRMRNAGKRRPRPPGVSWTLACARSSRCFCEG